MISKMRTRINIYGFLWPGKGNFGNKHSSLIMEKYDILFLIYEPSVKQATGKRSFNFASKELAFKARMDPFSD